MVAMVCGVSRHNQIDIAGVEFTRQGDDFAAAVVGVASHPGMSREDREVGAFGAHGFQHVVDRFLAPAERESHDVWGITNPLSGGRHEPDEGHTQP